MELELSEEDFMRLIETRSIDLHEQPSHHSSDTHGAQWVPVEIDLDEFTYDVYTEMYSLINRPDIPTDVKKMAQRLMDEAEKNMRQYELQ